MYLRKALRKIHPAHGLKCPVCLGVRSAGAGSRCPVSDEQQAWRRQTKRFLLAYRLGAWCERGRFERLVEIHDRVAHRLQMNDDRIDPDWPAQLGFLAMAVLSQQNLVRAIDDWEPPKQETRHGE